MKQNFGIKGGNEGEKLLPKIIELMFRALALRPSELINRWVQLTRVCRAIVHVGATVHVASTWDNYFIKRRFPWIRECGLRGQNWIFSCIYGQDMDSQIP